MEEQADSGLHHALEVLERSLHAPIVPGEAEQRADGLRRAAEKARAAFSTCAREEHRSSFREIADADPALLHRVDRMQEEDQALLDRWERALKELRALCDAAAARPWDEAAFRAEFEEHAPGLIELVLRTRSQRVAVRTWTSEAFKRDRGGGD